jgi:hypothetical protein
MIRFAPLLLLAGCDKLLSLNDIKAPPDVAPAILVQQTTSTAVMATMLQATLPQSPTSGNVLVMVGATPARSLMSVTGGGAIWQRGALSTVTANIELWFGVTDGSSATVTIACPVCPAEDMRMDLTEWSGVSPSTPFDVGSLESSGDMTMPATATLTTKHANDLLIFALSDGATIGDPGGAWLTLDNVSVGSDAQREWYQIVSAVGTYTPQVTVLTAWDAGLIALQLGG